MEQNDKIDSLSERLEKLIKKQEAFQEEILSLKDEINRLKSTTAEQILLEKINQIDTGTQVLEKQEAKASTTQREEEPTQKKLVQNHSIQNHSQPIRASKTREYPLLKEIRENTEKFIGESLINKIGILIILIGVSIGAKYAIDNDLINPLTRIIFGYALGGAILLFAFKLKENYKSFSAVLLSGAMAIFYFITYAAYDFYDLIPQTASFLLMVTFTVFTVFSAIQYNMQVIAHIGLLGAYVVPFALSENSGRVEILFGYMTIINIGILVIAFKKAWKPLFYSAFAVSWLIFSTWFFSGEYEYEKHFGIGLVFHAVFYLIFYATIFAYKIIANEKFTKADIAILLLNSFISYGVGYNIIEDSLYADELLGIYTLIHAITHFLAAILIFRKKLAVKDYLYFTTAMVLTFITIAIPVQFNGDWVTLTWSVEAVILFVLGQNGKIPVYRSIGYVMISLSVFSLVEDWGAFYDSGLSEVEDTFSPFFNIHFFTSIFTVIAFGYINFLHFKSIKTEQNHLLSGFLASAFILVFYFGIFLEIRYYFELMMSKSQIIINNTDGYEEYYFNTSLENFQTIALLGYTFIYIAVLMWLNIKYFKRKELFQAGSILSLLVLFVFLTDGLLNLGELRYSYIHQTMGQYFETGSHFVWVRYIMFILIGYLYFVIRKSLQSFEVSEKIHKVYQVILQVVIIWIISNELFNILELLEYKNIYKLSLSLLWGGYSVLLIVLGIWGKTKLWRIMAIVLFGVTLLKLFLYDIANMNTISKTIVFILLGVFLLIVSFLYNKYKNLIFDEDEKENI